jgi:hypothetical protein
MVLALVVFIAFSLIMPSKRESTELPAEITN